MLTHLNASPTPPARVVLLGGGGFVARALATQLKSHEIPVLAVASSQIDLTSPDAAVKLAALLNPSDAVVMLAALTPEKGRDLTTLIRNLRMADALCGAITAKPPSHLVYISSDAVYSFRHEKITESTPTEPSDLYGIMHLARELSLMQVAGARQIPFCILRPCAIYGAGDTHNSYGPNRFARSALTEQKIKLFGSGEETRDHINISDVTSLICQTLLHRGIGLLNLASGQSHAFAEVATNIKRLLGDRVSVESLPRTGPITHRHFDCTALRQAFPNYLPVRLERGLASLISGSKVSSQP